MFSTETRRTPRRIRGAGALKQPGASHVTSLRPHFPFCKMGTCAGKTYLWLKERFGPLAPGKEILSLYNVLATK
jgi:hypothetical protein